MDLIIFAFHQYIYADIQGILLSYLEDATPISMALVVLTSWGPYLIPGAEQYQA